MKKLLLILSLVTILITSCEKAPVGCGEVIGYGNVDCSSGNCYYWLPIKFDNGQVDNQVSVNESTWINFLPGDRICF
jgi:hypothetical protein